jgi:hypothetical protein
MRIAMRLAGTVLVAFVFFSCATNPAVYEFDPQSASDGTVEIEPWLGEDAFLFKITNLGDETVILDEKSFVLVAPSGEARHIGVDLESSAVPAESHTYAVLSGPTTFRLEPDEYLIDLSNPSGSSISSSYISTEEERLQDMRSRTGETLRVRFVYSLATETREQLSEFTISGVRVIEAQSSSSSEMFP